jgi:hypothetical protein
MASSEGHFHLQIIALFLHTNSLYKDTIYNETCIMGADEAVFSED